MKNEQHTPGQWKIGRAASDIAIYGPLGAHVATLPDMLARGEVLANARLMAAAPDLLAALESIHANAAESAEWIRHRTSAAIAKATGGAS